jgi:LAGLIDADG endonuclease
MIKNQTNIKFQLTPGYIAGLTQTDGSISCGIVLSNNNKIAFVPSFNLTMDLDSKYVLESIQKYFGCGRLQININNYTVDFIVTVRSDLINIIIPFFKEYKLFGPKLHAFNLFVKIVETLKDGPKSLTAENKKELAIMALSMNKTTSRKEERFEDIKVALCIKKDDKLSLIPNTEIYIEHEISDDTIAGIIDGDGSFWVSFSAVGQIRTGFSITADVASVPLLKAIRNKFNNVGSILSKKITYSTYYVHGINQIVETIIPFMDKNPIFSERANHYNIFKRVSLILYNKKPLSLEDKLFILDLAYDSNKKGKRRRFSKEEYIKILQNKNKEK